DGPERPLEGFLVSLWQEVLQVRAVGERDDFFELGGSSIQVAILTHKLEDKLEEFVYTVALYDAPTIASLAQYLRVNYPRSVARLFGRDALNGFATSSSDFVEQTDIDALRRLIRTLPERAQREVEPKNLSAVFVLSPPRSGSTLLRVMLGGHPALF